MNHYTVEWTPTAEDQLAIIWLRATNRNAVTASQATIDRLLASDPYSNGSPVAEELRKLVVPPLKVYFQIHEIDKKVEVTEVYELA